MKRTGLVSKGTLTRLRVQTQQAWEDRDLPKCIEILERIRRMAPADIWALHQLGRMHGLLYDYAAAESCFERAYRLTSPDQRAKVLAEAGQQSRDFYDSSMSERFFERAVEEKGATPDMLVRAAEVSERNRRMEEAADRVDRALAMDKANPAGPLAHAHLEHRAGRHESAERELRPLLQLEVTPEVRVKAWYEMGAVLDRQKRYDEAMKAFLQAKALLRHQGEPPGNHRRGVLKRYAQWRDDLNGEVLQRWFKDGEKLQPPQRLVLLGGHPRSGTTLLEQVLDSHADIVSMEETDNFRDYVGIPLTRRFEPNAPFLPTFDSAPLDVLRSFRNNYRNAAEGCIGSPIGERVLVDKHPAMTMSIPGLVRAFPEIRLLIALRDPRDVVLSCFMQPFLPLGPGNALFLSLDGAAEEYAAVMSMWLKLKPLLPNPHLEVRYEDMVEDLESVARPTLEFVGVSWDERVLGFDEHARSKQVRSPTYADVTQKVFKRARGRWRNYEKYLEPQFHKLESFMKAFGYE